MFRYGYLSDVPIGLISSVATHGSFTPRAKMRSVIPTLNQRPRKHSNSNNILTIIKFGPPKKIRLCPSMGSYKTFKYFIQFTYFYQ